MARVNEEKSTNIIREIEKVIVGKKKIIEKVFMAILAEGHILLDDVPGVGKTSMAMAFGKVLDMEYKRVQFTPDVLPSDIVGYSIYDRESDELRYVPGVINTANLLLCDEINRTSSKTQSALLEAMEEGRVTVDGSSHELMTPFVVIATQNHVGTVGTQLLPQAQLDRFLVKLSIGYPDEESQKEILRQTHGAEKIEDIKKVVKLSELSNMQEEAGKIHMAESIIEYITALTFKTRENECVDLGLSPRGAIAVSRMSKASAYLHGRDYVIPEDVIDVWCDVCSHRIILSRNARLHQKNENDVLNDILNEVPVPDRYAHI